MAARRRTAIRLAAVAAMAATAVITAPLRADAKTDPQPGNHECLVGWSAWTDDGLFTDLVHHSIEPWADPWVDLLIPDMQWLTLTGPRPLHETGCAWAELYGL